MHILMGVLAALGTIAYLVIRAGQINKAGRELAETAHDVRCLVRRSRWKSRTAVDVLRDIRDPRLAATIILYAIAKSEGEVTERQRTEILATMASMLGMSHDEATNTYAEVRWLLRDLHDAPTILRRAAPAIFESCDGAEIEELIAATIAVAKVEGEPSEHQQLAIESLDRKLRPAR